MNMLLTSNLIGIDIVLIVILLIFVIVGMCKGFANSVLSFVGTVVAFILAIILCDDLLRAIQPTNLYQSVKAFFENIFPVDNNASTESLGLPDFLVKALQELGADIDLSTAVATVLTNAILGFCCFLVILLSIKIICFVLKKIFSVLTQLPIIGLVNRLLGGALGLINGIFIVSAVLFIFSIFPISALDGLRNLINSSSITSFFYNNNIYSLIF